MAINGIQTNANQATAYPVMQNEVKAADTNVVDTATEQVVSKNNTDTFTMSNGAEEVTGIYSPDTASVTSTNATSSNISGTNSIISQKKKAFAKQVGLSLDSSLNPIVNSAADGQKATKYYQLLCKTTNSSGYNANYVANQNDSGNPYSGNCFNTSMQMMAKMNSNGTAKMALSGGVAYIENGTKKSYSTKCDKTEYSPNKTGYNQYTGLTKEELSNIIVSEIDNGRVVQLHTDYSGGQHWVVVTGYTLDSSGNISLTTEGGKNYITGLTGVDPFKSTDPTRPQYTTNLGKKAGVSQNGQWLKTVDGGYEVRTYKP